jgi:hypothetical protein
MRHSPGVSSVGADGPQSVRGGVIWDQQQVNRGVEEAIVAYRREEST